MDFTEHFLVQESKIAEDFCINKTNHKIPSSPMFSQIKDINISQSLLYTLIVTLVLFKFVTSTIQWISSNFRHFLMTSIQVSGSTGCYTGSLDDQVYLNLLKWLGRHMNNLQNEKVLPKTKSTKKPKPKDINVNDEDKDHDEDEDYSRQVSDRDWACELGKTIGYGTNYLIYKNTVIKATREIMTPRAQVYNRSQEIIRLSSYFWNKSLLQEILEKSKPKAEKTDEKTLVIYKACTENNCWNRLGGPKKKRPLDSIILDSQVIRNLLDDIKEFMELEDWYVERGIPYRRGYLLYGPPGCGKSSIIKAIAGEIGYDISIFSLSQKLTDDSMTELLNSAPEKSILLLEDIDAAFKSRDDFSATSRETNLAFEGCSQSSLTFRGLLNALDGVASADDGQLVFMTTNYPDRLDSALVRPGRVDLKIAIDYPNDFQIEGMFKRFYPDADEETKTLFVNAIRKLDLKISMAMLQGLMLVYKKKPQDAINNAKKHFEEQFTNSNLTTTHLYT